MAGCSIIWTNPRTVSIENQTTIAGPKKNPTFCVPNRWKKNKPHKITIIIGNVGIPGTTSPRPSTAEATEMGGVIIPSAKSVVAPRIVGITSNSIIIVRLSITSTIYDYG